MATEGFSYKLEEVNKNSVLSTLTRYQGLIYIYTISTGEWTDTSKITVESLLGMLKGTDNLYLRVVQTAK